MSLRGLVAILVILASVQAVSRVGAAPSTRAEEALARAEYLRHRQQPQQAVEIYQQLLSDPTLKKEDEIRARFALAQTLESIPGRGELARQTYRKIRDLYPDEAISVDAAYRLGCLYHSILLPGTAKSISDALEQFKYVLEHSPPNRLISLKAHMNLGNLFAEIQEFDKSQAHFQAIYDFDATTLEEPKGSVPLSEQERKQKMKALHDELQYMRDRAVMHMVDVCISPDPEEAIARLQELRNRYPDDPRVTELTREKFKVVTPALFEDVDNIIAPIADSLLSEAESAFQAEVTEQAGQVQGTPNIPLSRAQPVVEEPALAQPVSSVSPLWFLITGVVVALSLAVGVLLLVRKHCLGQQEYKKQ